MKDRLAAIEARNARVELDKRWETSLTRRISIALLTYGIMVWLLHLLDAAHPWANALVPVCGYVLSTLSLPYVRRLWERNKKDQK